MAEKIKTTEANYCCVSCGAAADELSHHYKEGVIKIIHCVCDCLRMDTGTDLFCTLEF